MSSPDGRDPRRHLIIGGVDHPFLVAIATALAGGSDYWAGLAVGWLEVIAPTPEILELLRAVRTAPWASQRTRHAASEVFVRFAGAERR